MRTPDAITPAAAELDTLLRSSGLGAFLARLNARTRFRFTGAYRAEPPMLRNVHLFDRENPSLNVSGAICPLDETYCSLVRESGAPFETSDAPHDARLREHAARDAVLSYFGVPIRRTGGGVWGTLCHFDVRPRLIPLEELPMLEVAAALLAERLAEG